jgi:uncharacterized repeat protein (TIGR03803 family)
MNGQRGAAIAVAYLGWKSRVASAIFVVLALLLASLAIYAPAARAESGREVVLHSFDGTDGKGPTAGMIQGLDGNLYGTTVNGGANYPFASGAGTVFQLTPSGTLNTLYSFCSVVAPATGYCLDGVGPFAGLIQGSDGNFYGTTLGGGASPYPNGSIGYGTVFKLTPSGTLTTLYSFCSQADCTDGDGPSAGVIQGSDGNFYGTTNAGGAKDDGTVFKLTPSTTPNDSTLNTLYSFCSVVDPRTGYCLDGEVPSAGVIQGSDGNFYGTTYTGGAKNDGTVFKLTPSGQLTTLHSFCTKHGPRKRCLDGQNPASVVQGSDGNFYGITNLGGAKNDGTVFKLTPSGKLTTLHSFCREAGCADGKFPDGSLIQGSDGNFYGTTEGGGAGIKPLDYGTVFKITPSGKLTTLYSFCSGDEPGASICFDGWGPIAGVIEGSNGNFYGTATFGGANADGTLFEVDTPGHMKVVPAKLTLKAEPNAQASASITIENTGTGQVTVDVSEPKHQPPFSEAGGGSSIAIAAGGSYEVTIKYSPTSSTTNNQQSDSITVTPIGNDPEQKQPINVKLKGEK